MSPRRSRLEIRLSILSAVRDGVDKPTRIMYAANLSWKPTQRVLGQLLEQGLISEESGDGSGRSRRWTGCYARHRKSESPRQRR